MSADRWLEVAFGELTDHVAEIFGPRNNARIIEYHSTTTLRATTDEVPWCSAFVCWVMERAGIVSTRSAAARSWLEWLGGGDMQVPRFGAVTVLERGESGSGKGHVGFFLGSRAGRVNLLSGNVNDRVKTEWFEGDRVLGFRWPKGAA